MCNKKIDFVIPWVDGNDPEWRKEKNYYDSKSIIHGSNGETRYRDWENLKYLFRGIEKFAPWVNCIYFITWGHLPQWLNINHSKIKIVNHKDYIPAKYLPVFSSHPIELNLHNIKDLSEQFVLFNDDTFIISKVEKEDFFRKGKPCDNYNEVNLDFKGEDEVFSHIITNNYTVLNKHYNKRKMILKRPLNYMNVRYGLKRNLQTLRMTFVKDRFCGINNNHLPQPFLKCYFKKVWDLENQTLDLTSSHKFRSKEDVNQYLIRYFQLMDGNFIPKNFKSGKFFVVQDDNRELLNCIEKQKCKMICINDSDKNIDFQKCKKEINNAFDKILSEKCSFEK